MSGGVWAVRAGTGRGRDVVAEHDLAGVNVERVPRLQGGSHGKVAS